ncbi:hypothetical protein LSH36_116g00032 [Paralvinella palmiformis]|uniref:Sulfotransferase n=1 Tax=Paralvinella palmiformis TaxID=53620 RepID=A0AAD9K067_9ANNE|nr:hypothetical protein LSH36_116g00032 [Paralvinella palmiformis]
MDQSGLVSRLKQLILLCVSVSCLFVAFGTTDLYELLKSKYRTVSIQKRFEPTCNTTLFHEELRLDDDPPYIPRELLAHCEKVLYNRIPKSASTTFRNIFDILAPQNNLTAIFLQKKWKMSERIRNSFIDHTRLPFNAGFLLTCHYYFDSFEDIFGDTATYIQVIREPSDWILSYLNWQKYGSERKPGGRKNLGDMNIETCIYDEDCTERKYNFAGSLRFICGQADICQSGTEESLRLAVNNIERYYLVVGLFEDLPAYVEVLEYLMPHVFFNITNVFADEVSVALSLDGSYVSVLQAALQSLDQQCK